MFSFITLMIFFLNTLSFIICEIMDSKTDSFCKYIHFNIKDPSETRLAYIAFVSEYEKHHRTIVKDIKIVFKCIFNYNLEDIHTIYKIIVNDELNNNLLSILNEQNPDVTSVNKYYFFQNYMNQVLPPSDYIVIDNLTIFDKNCNDHIKAYPKDEIEERLRTLKQKEYQGILIDITISRYNYPLRFIFIQTRENENEIVVI